MTASPPAPCAWMLADRIATQEADGLVARLDLAAPARGIGLSADGESRADRLLGVDLRSECRLMEQWLRGEDVVAVYEPADARKLRATAMWRRQPRPGICSWEVVVSAQTSLVQSDSAVAVVSEVDATDLLWGVARHGEIHWTPCRHGEPQPEAATCVLARRAAATTALIAVHPDDVRQLAVRRHGGRARIECWLFSTAIEKGVLLRSRVLAALGPAANDAAWAGAIVHDFAASPPPLTA